MLEQLDIYLQKIHKVTLDINFAPFTKINLICITDLNVKHKVVKLEDRSFRWMIW